MLTIKKKWQKVIIPIILLICIIAFFEIRYPRKSFDNLLETKESNITFVLMRSGTNGHHVETSDKTKIKELINLLDDRYYREIFIQSPSSGYSYYYNFYSGNKVILSVVGGGDIVNVNGIYYRVRKGISRDSLEKWFNSLPILTD